MVFLYDFNEHFLMTNNVGHFFVFMGHFCFFSVICLLRLFAHLFFCYWFAFRCFFFLAVYVYIVIICVLFQLGLIVHSRACLVNKKVLTINAANFFFYLFTNGLPFPSCWQNPTLPQSHKNILLYCLLSFVVLTLI